MPYAYAVLGAGRQGIAAAYDMARWGNARRVIIADRNLEIARRGAERVNALTGKSTAESAHLDVTDLKAVERLLTGVDACLSAVPYTYNLDITRAAISAKANVCDLGGDPRHSRWPTRPGHHPDIPPHRTAPQRDPAPHRRRPVPQRCRLLRLPWQGGQASTPRTTGTLPLGHPGGSGGAR